MHTEHPRSRVTHHFFHLFLLFAGIAVYAACTAECLCLHIRTVLRPCIGIRPQCFACLTQFALFCFVHAMTVDLYHGGYSFLFLLPLCPDLCFFCLVFSVLFHATPLSLIVKMRKSRSEFTHFVIHDNSFRPRNVPSIIRLFFVLFTFTWFYDHILYFLILNISTGF